VTMGRTVRPSLSALMSVLVLSSSRAVQTHAHMGGR